MSKKFNDLSQSKQAELNKVVSVIQTKCDDVEMIILYGSYARGDYKEEKDLAPDRKSGHVSDYDILIVTQKKETATQTLLWKEILEICHAQGITVSVRIIAHDIMDLNIQLAEDQYFFREIREEGIFLYNSGKYELAQPRELKPEEKQRIAQDMIPIIGLNRQNLRHWLKKLRNFWKLPKQAVNGKLRKLGIDSGLTLAGFRILLGLKRFTAKIH